MRPRRPLILQSVLHATPIIAQLSSPILRRRQTAERHWRCAAHTYSVPWRALPPCHLAQTSKEQLRHHRRSVKQDEAALVAGQSLEPLSPRPVAVSWRPAKTWKLGRHLGERFYLSLSAHSRLRSRADRVLRKHWIPCEQLHRFLRDDDPNLVPERPCCAFCGVETAPCTAGDPGPAPLLIDTLPKPIPRRAAPSLVTLVTDLKMAAGELSTLGAREAQNVRAC